jgi:excisionase family DNA binding protein
MRDASRPLSPSTATSTPRPTRPSTLDDRVPRLAYRITEAAEALGVGRTKVYELINSGELPSIRIGGSLRVPVDALQAWIVRQVEASAE